jgi:hypothetical protein
MMHRVQTEKEEWEALQRRGFTDGQIRALRRLRKTYGQNWMDLPALDVRRLEFARYLVTNGRLNEGENAQPVADEKTTNAHVGLWANFVRGHIQPRA